MGTTAVKMICISEGVNTGSISPGERMLVGGFKIE